MHSSTDTDPTELLRRARDGSPAAWDEVVRRYTPLLRSRISGFRLQEADAQDVAQTTWMRLAENLHRVHTPGHLAGWLATVVTRECIRVRRCAARAVPTDDVVVAAVPDPRPGPEQIVLDRETRRAVRAALDTLPPHRRVVLEALFADDRRPYAEIARDLRIPVGSLGPTRVRTLTGLRRALEPAVLAG